jgi:hypothetical protein
MPNWCNNVLTIKGDPDELEDFIQSMDVPGTLKFHDFVPEPDDIGADVDKVLTWRCTHWGTKWDLGDSDNQQMTRSIDGTVLTFTFQTAWSPPQPFVAYVSEQFEHLEFYLSYFEPLMGFAGYIGYIDGCEQDDTSITWENMEEYKEQYMNTPEQYKVAWMDPDECSDSEDDESDAESTSTDAD